MKILKHPVAMFAVFVILFLISSYALAATDVGGLSDDIKGTAQSWWEMGWAVVPYIAAFIILISLVSIKFVGWGAPAMIILACVGIGAIPLIIKATMGATI